MTETLIYTGTLRIVTCWCGIHVGIPEELHTTMQSEGKICYCPLGHQFVFSMNEADRQRERADLAESALRRARARETHLRDQISAEQRSNASYRGWITRYRNKIATGVCPVDDCRRHFDNVQRHVERMHPEWAHAHPDALTA
jgi:hypothetical protein